MVNSYKYKICIINLISQFLSQVCQAWHIHCLKPSKTPRYYHLQNCFSLLTIHLVLYEVRHFRRYSILG